LVSALTLICDELLSSFAVNFNLRRFVEVSKTHAVWAVEECLAMMRERPNGGVLLIHHHDLRGQI
jgi:hypothetical protein